MTYANNVRKQQMNGFFNQFIRTAASAAENSENFKFFLLN